MTRDFHGCSVVLRHFQQCSEVFISVKRCSIFFSNDQRFSVLIIAVSALKIAEFLLYNNTEHGCFNSVTVILIEIHAMCINYQFSKILKNLIASLIQSAVSMIIAESSKDINPDKLLLIFQTGLRVYSMEESNVLVLVPNHVLGVGAGMTCKE